MIDGFTTYKLFSATKLHFTNEKYDLAIYNGKINGLSHEKFERRNDAKLFIRLGKQFKTRRDLVQYFVANFAYGNTSFVWDADGVSERNYKLWIKRKESLLSLFKEELSFIELEVEKHRYIYNQVFYTTTDTEYPLLLTWYLGNQISIETLSILNEFANIIDKWQSLILLWHDYFLRIQRVSYFVKYNKIKANKIFTDFIENSFTTIEEETFCSHHE